MVQQQQKKSNSINLPKNLFGSINDKSKICLFSEHVVRVLQSSYNLYKEFGYNQTLV